MRPREPSFFDFWYNWIDSWGMNQFWTDFFQHAFPWLAGVFLVFNFLFGGCWPHYYE